MDVSALARSVAEDRAAGRRPFLVVGTAGTTTAGAIDPLPEIADLCARERLWFHADAAWGGGALLSPRLGRHLAGIERADSVTWDAHKWLQTPLGGGMFFTRHPESLAAAFATESGYMPVSRGGVDPSNVSHQWSRRAPGIAVFCALAELGADGWGRLVEAMTSRGESLRAKLGAAGFVVLNDTPLPLVNFTHARIEDGVVTTGEAARAVHRSGRAWISPAVRSDGRTVLRACITSFRTEERDLDLLVDELRAALGDA
jgi:glutamate/tyrosine decarboxylase-like PLP-dependent enzyme